MGGKSKTNLSGSEASFNFVNKDAEMFNKSKERFWQAESYYVLKRDNPNLMLKVDRKAINNLTLIRMVGGKARYPKRFLTFGFNPFATLVWNFKFEPSVSPKLLN